MARFRFKIVDSQGRRRSGILRAESLEVAESALRSKLCQIDELTPLDDDGAAVEMGHLETSFSQADHVRRGLALVLACVGVLCLVSWLRAPRAKTIAVESNEVVEFVVSGELETSNSLDLSESTVYAAFPELPYEIEGRLAEDGRSFSLPFFLTGVGRPKKVLLEVAVDGTRWQAPAAVDIPSTGDVNLGRVEVRPPPQPKKIPRPEIAPRRDSTEADHSEPSDGLSPKSDRETSKKHMTRDEMREALRR